jgi:hypothetical protein
MSNFGSLDMVMRNAGTKLIANVSMTSTAQNDPIMLKGTVASFDGKESLPITVFLSQAEIAKVALRQVSPTAMVLSDANSGELSNYSVRDFTKSPAIDGRYEIYSGTYIDDAANEIQFFGITDPEPATLTIVVVVALACVLVIGIEKLTTDCKQDLAAGIAACQATGGYPQINADVYFGLSLSPFKVGCGVNCQLTCNPPLPKLGSAAGIAPVTGGG